jgi:hypothetical protein
MNCLPVEAVANSCKLDKEQTHIFIRGANVR